MSWRGEAPTEKTHTEPFSPAGFYDLLIPSELTWSREKSMVVRTKSFAGGVLYFSGRVDINSLVDYFTTTMPRNNWRLVGSAQDRNVMLVFTKPHKNATIVIGRADLTGRTEAQIHITDDLSQGQKSSSSAPARPFAF
ncbi:MAG: hypothetical protein EYX74_07580 [Desulfobulbaceae bacterium]|nr:MAG: hypothetical protein EYX74_07580 [Desulfobulbaceae bacterium]